MYSIDYIIVYRNRNNIHHYIDNLFGTKIGGATAILQSKLLFETLLYWFDNLNDTYKSTNIATKRTLIIGRKCDINLQMLKEWGKSVKKDLSERCVSNISSLGDVVQVINDI